MSEKTFLKLETADGKPYRSTMSYEEFLERLRRVESSIDKLEHRLFIVEKPLRKKSIIEILKREGIRSYGFLRRNAWNFQPSDLRELVNEGKVAETRHGHVWMYSVKREHDSRSRENE